MVLLISSPPDPSLAGAAVVPFCFFSPSAEVNEALLKGTDFAKPLVFSRFSKALFSVFGHHFDAACLGRVNLQEAAFDAGVLMNARGGIGAMACAQSDPAEEEVLFEFAPLLGRRGPEFTLGSGLTAALDEGVVRLNDVLRKDGLVSPGRFQIQVTQKRGDNMQRKARPDKLRGEEAAKVMRGEGDRRAGISEACMCGAAVEDAADIGVRENVLAWSDQPCEQVRQGFSEGLFVGVVAD